MSTEKQISGIYIFSAKAFPLSFAHSKTSHIRISIHLKPIPRAWSFTTISFSSARIIMIWVIALACSMMSTEKNLISEINIQVQWWQNALTSKMACRYSSILPIDIIFILSSLSYIIQTEIHISRTTPIFTE